MKHLLFLVLSFSFLPLSVHALTCGPDGVSFDELIDMLNKAAPQQPQQILKNEIAYSEKYIGFDAASLSLESQNMISVLEKREDATDIHLRVLLQSRYFNNGQASDIDIVEQQMSFPKTKVHQRLANNDCFYNLKSVDILYPVPDLVRMRSNCGGLADCDSLKATEFSFTGIQNSRLTNYKMILSSQTPYFSSYMKFCSQERNSSNPWACESIKDFTFGQP